MKQVPETSREAYKNMQPKIPSDQELILSVLSYENDMTYNEISKAVRLKLYNEEKTFEAQSWVNPNKVSRRMKELLESKKIISGEVRECSIVKSKCKTYLLKKLHTTN